MKAVARVTPQWFGGVDDVPLTRGTHRRDIGRRLTALESPGTQRLILAHSSEFPPYRVDFLTQGVFLVDFVRWRDAYSYKLNTYRRKRRLRVRCFWFRVYVTIQSTLVAAQFDFPRHLENTAVWRLDDASLSGPGYAVFVEKSDLSVSRLLAVVRIWISFVFTGIRQKAMFGLVAWGLLCVVFEGAERFPQRGRNPKAGITSRNCAAHKGDSHRRPVS